jgi:gluconolactonase
MKKFSVIFLLVASLVVLLIVFAVPTQAQTQEQSSILRMDPALDSIVPPNAKVEKLADTSDAGTREGPLWIRKGGYLLYSDLDAKSINKSNPANGQASNFLENTNSNGLTLDTQGRLVFAARGQIVRIEKDARRTVLASEYQGKPLNVPNDIVSKSDGALYFTDPGHIQRDKDQNVIFSDDVPSVYLLRNGKLQLLTKDVSFPNGLAFSPGEKYLYVNNSAKMTITRFDVLRDDTIANPQLFIDESGENPDKIHALPSTGFPDGMKVDQKGNVYCTGPGGVWIISPDGKHQGTIQGLNHPTNIAFGDADGKSLYVVSRPGVYRIRVRIPGIRP